MTEELEQLLKNLKLRRILEIYEEQLRAADKDDISYTDFVTRLVRAQWQAKQEGALEWRIQRANLPDRAGNGCSHSARDEGVDPPGGARGSGAQRRYLHAGAIPGPGCGSRAVAVRMRRCRPPSPARQSSNRAA